MRDLYTVAYGFIRQPFLGMAGDSEVGAFFRPPADDGSMPELRVIAASGDGWDHVSVSTQSRTPTWAEMELVKHAFFEDDETAMQLHVPPSKHINNHPYCLHLWRPHDVAIPTPPTIMV